MTRGQPGTSGILNGYTGGGPTVLRAQTAPVSFAPVESDAGIRVLADTYLTELEQIFPGVSALHNQKATLSLPHNDANFRLSYSFWRVGQYQAFAGYERAPQGRIYFAGEHCSVLFQGFMEGGASEGIRAAQEVLAADLSHPAAPTPPVARAPAACACDDTAAGAPVAAVAAVAVGAAIVARPVSSPQSAEKSGTLAVDPPQGERC